MKASFVILGNVAAVAARSAFAVSRPRRREEDDTDSSGHQHCGI